MTGRPGREWFDPDRIVGLLTQLYDTPADVNAWLDTPQPLLDGLVPSKLMETPEGFALVLSRLRAICDGAYL